MINLSFREKLSLTATIWFKKSIDVEVYAGEFPEGISGKKIKDWHVSYERRTLEDTDNVKILAASTFLKEYNKLEKKVVKKAVEFNSNLALINNLKIHPKSDPRTARVWGETFSSLIYLVTAKVSFYRKNVQDSYE